MTHCAGAWGWSRADLDRPHVLVESVAGTATPARVHLQALAEQVVVGSRRGGRPARYMCTDMCDGIAQGTDGMDYSLLSRDLIAAVCEMHARSGHDAVVFISSCDKAVPAHLMAAARLDLPTVHVPGGRRLGRGDATVDQIGTIAAALRRGELSVDEYREWVDTAVPSCGACAFLGTALTSQVIADAGPGPAALGGRPGERRRHRGVREGRGRTGPRPPRRRADGADVPDAGVAAQRDRGPRGGRRLVELPPAPARDRRRGRAERRPGRTPADQHKPDDKEPTRRRTSGVLLQQKYQPVGGLPV